MKKLKHIGIKTKLILLFIVIKVIPLFTLLYIAINGVNHIANFLIAQLEQTNKQNLTLINSVVKKAIDDGIEALDRRSQSSYEKVTVYLASQIAQFLYERDDDIRFLATLDPSNELFRNFFYLKQKDVIKTPRYIYDDNSSKWIKADNQTTKIKNKDTIKPIKDNAKNFHYVQPAHIEKIKLPIYKEIAYFDLKGKEKYKYSKISNKLLDISKQQNTYLGCEDYFDKIQHLKKGEIYVSNVVGQYIGSKVIGDFTKEKAKKMNIDFKPQQYAFAGKENPLGKRFEAIVRFVTPVYKHNKKVGYIPLALDHRHIMEFTDSINITSENILQDIPDASNGNYAFMWDNNGRSISHPRDYFIVGFDPKTHKRVIPWVSRDIAEQFKQSSYKSFEEFLKHYPKYHNQTSVKKPNISQLFKDGSIALDCRYLNFAPQCTGWDKIASKGGYGSFVIYWSGVWKLTTIATIPYYTGDYGKSKKGFGYITIGANVKEFHKPANQTKKALDQIVQKSQQQLQKQILEAKNKVKVFLDNIVNQLSLTTVLLTIVVILIAILIANYFTKKIQELIYATKELANGNFDISLNMHSNDEMGMLAKSFQHTVDKMKILVDEKNKTNENLEQKIAEALEDNRLKTQQMIEQSRLAQMGQMISMIAHQWRQPLSAISATSSALEIKAQLNKLTNEQIVQYVGKISQYAKHLSTTINDFRDFFKPNKLKQEVSTNELVSSVLQIIQTSLRNKNITIDLHLESNKKLMTYANELKQVVLNLIKNAEDVLLEKKVANPIIKITTTSNTICIEDNGGGVKDEIKDKIFDPYFSTKDKNGTGLGLYMSKIIIEEHCKGTLEEINTKDGAKFIIRLKDGDIENV